MKVKVESEKVDLKLNNQKTNIMASSLITSWHIDRKTMETVTDFIFLVEGLASTLMAANWSGVGIPEGCGGCGNFLK